ncbi:Uncharacterised protein [Mycobacterium tuberculosis]|nr:Uncharacterised protein [Mycobacterium tuberculosis]
MTRTWSKVVPCGVDSKVSPSCCANPTIASRFLAGKSRRGISHRAPPPESWHRTGSPWSARAARARAR